MMVMLGAALLCAVCMYVIVEHCYVHFDSVVI